MELENAIKNYLEEMNIKTDRNISELIKYAAFDNNGREERIKMVRWLIEEKTGLITNFKSLKKELGFDKYNIHFNDIYPSDVDIFNPFYYSGIKRLYEGKFILTEENIEIAKKYVELVERIDEIVKENKTNGV